MLLENAPAGADEGLLPQCFAPVAQRLRRKGVDDGCETRLAPP